ncbi:DUF4192 domain-containing protein [Streptomyces sp. NPDC059161]|uniref:DUF4192 domain-containing protein n=1 Tax=Streptomyces sp. NPDC059161 TaxID=3346749 RepID=UPI0036B17DB8
MTQPLRIDNPSDFIELMPFLLGYTPQDALVVYGITNIGLAGPVMTLSLPTDPAQWRHVAQAVASEFIHSNRGRGIDVLDVVVCLYRTPQPGQAPEATAHLLGHMADWMIDAFVDLGHAPVKHVLGIVGNQWWDYSCYWPGCCEGETLPVGDHPESVTAQLRALGYASGRTSGEIVAEFRPTQTCAARYRQAIDQAGADFLRDTSTRHGLLLGRDSTLRIIDGALRDLRNDTPIGDEPAARIILGLQDRHARDRALSQGPADELPYERRLWADLARRCVPPFTDLAPPLLTLFAWVAWRQGDTASARHALRAAITLDNDYALARQLHQGLNRDVPADRLLEAFRTAAAEDAANDEAALRTL